MVHDGSTDILAVNGLLLSYTWRTLHWMQHCNRDVSADVPEYAHSYRQNNGEEREVNQSTEMLLDVTLFL